MLRARISSTGNPWATCKHYIKKFVRMRYYSQNKNNSMKCLHHVVTLIKHITLSLKASWFLFWVLVSRFSQMSQFLGFFSFLLLTWRITKRVLTISKFNNDIEHNKTNLKKQRVFNRNFIVTRTYMKLTSELKCVEVAIFKWTVFYIYPFSSLVVTGDGFGNKKLIWWFIF